MPGVTVDGMNVLAVKAEGEKAVARARKGEGPTLIECKTYRYLGHFVGDPGTDYRTKEEVETWKKKDAIGRLRTYLLEKKIADESELVQMEKKVRNAVEDAIRYGRESESPSPEEALEDIYLL